MNHSLSSQTLSSYPSIDTFSKLVSNSPSIAPLSATILLDLCRNVARDLTYVSRLQEDVQSTLKVCPAYHTQWIDEVRRAASEALVHADTHISAKIPQEQALSLLNGSSRELKSKIVSVIRVGKKDKEGIASLRERLSTAHGSLMGAAGLMQQLALRSGDLLPNREQIQCFKPLSLESLGQAANQNPNMAASGEISNSI
jgi:hypothetical protein